MKILSLLANYSLGKSIAGVLLLVSVPLLVAGFGAEAYGAYSRVWAVSMIASHLFGGWLRQGLLRRSGDSTVSLLGVGPMVPLLVNTAVGLCTAGYALSEPALGGRMSVAIAGLLFGYTFSSCLAFEVEMQRNSFARAYSLGMVLRTLGISVLPVLLVEHVVVEGIYILALGVCGNAAALATYRMKVGRRLGSDVNWRGLFHYGWPMSGWLALSGLCLYVDRFLINVFFDSNTSGVYAALADLVIRGFGMGILPVLLVSHPRVMKAWNIDPILGMRQLRAWRTVAIAVLVLGCTLLVPLYLLAPAIGLDMGSLGLPVVLALGAGAAAWNYGQFAHKEHEFVGATRVMLLCLFTAACIQTAIGYFLMHTGDIRIASTTILVGALVYLVLIRASGPDLSSFKPHVSSG